MNLLGRRIAELHHAFARVTGDAAFDPEPVSQAELESWKASVLADVARTLDALAQGQDRYAAEVQPMVAQALGLRAQLEERVRALDCDTSQLVKTRYHGDLHFGQVLIVQNDFVIIDFEGEPARPIDERRRKHSPLRDVAGMLRSISYASHSALARLAAEKADARDAFAAALGDWERQSALAFSAGYREAASGLASVPADPGALKTLTDLFVLEKALYELRYEMDNRPDWIHIPLRGLLTLLPA